MSQRNFKIKPLCDVFGENTIWNLLYVHVLFATAIGWGYFIIGNVLLVKADTPLLEILKYNVPAAYFAMWTASFLLAIHIYKGYNKK